MKNLQNKRILTISEAAEYSGYSKKLIKYWVDNKFINHECPPSSENKRIIRIRTVELENFLDNYHVMNCFYDEYKYCDCDSFCCED